VPVDDTANDNGNEKSPARFIKWIALVAVGLVVLVYAGIFIYTKVINDSPDELDQSDLSEALETTTVPAADSTPPSDPPTTESAVSNSTGSTNSVEPSGGLVSFDADWTATAASEFGYRVDEVIAGVSATAVGRSNEIDGLLTIDGTTATAVDAEVQIASITSDDSRRDGRFRGAIMNSSEFPTAMFTLTEPIEFGVIPADGGQVVATATGELTLRGVTNRVTFEVTAEATNDRIGILGSIPVVFADYGIDNPSFGAIKTEDEGLVEFVLVFEQP
jgi:polyisoprenoid-binding protein YceI